MNKCLNCGQRNCSLLLLDRDVKNCGKCDECRFVIETAQRNCLNNSKKWFELYEIALKEIDRLNIEAEILRKRYDNIIDSNPLDSGCDQ